MKSSRATYHRFIAEHTRHPDQIVRSEAARLLGEIGDKAAVPWLVDMLKKDARHSKINAIYALAEIRDRRAIPVLLEISRDPGVFDFNGFYNHDMIRIAAAIALALLGDARGEQQISDLLRLEAGEAFRQLTPYVSGLSDAPLLRPFKKKCVIRPDQLRKPGKGFNTVRDARIAESLRHDKMPAARACLLGYCKHYSRYVRAHAAESLSILDSSPVFTRFLKTWLRKEKAAFTRIKLAFLLVKRGAAAARAILLQGLKDPDFFIRATAIDALAALQESSAAPHLQLCLEDEHFYVRLCAIEALEKLRCTKASGQILTLFQQDHPRVQMQAAKYALATRSLAGRRETVK